MKTIFTTAVAALMSSFAFAQQVETLTLQPDATKGKDAYVFQLDNQTHAKWGATNDKNYGNSVLIPSTDWTWDGINGKQRSFIEFDFSSIPANAIITKAELNLYHNPDQASWSHSQKDGSNELLVQKVTESWEEDKITWNNQPTTTTDGQIEVPKSTSNTQDYVIDVKSLVQTMIGAGNNNGFMMKLKTESHYRNVIFSSSDYTNAEEHPKLVVEYQVPITKLTLKPGAEGKDAYVFQLDNQTHAKWGATNDKNYGNSVLIPSTDWTWDGINGKQRSFIEFDFSSIPTNAIIKKAALKLYHNPDQASWSHSQKDGSNELLVQKVTESWEEDKITWNNQPTTTTDGQIEVPKSISNTQDYVIDVKSLVQTMIGAGNNNGFMMKLKIESHYRNVIFSSSDYTNAAEHPELVIEYEMGTVTSTQNVEETKIAVYPNPFSESTTFDLGENGVYTISLYSANGQLVKEIVAEGSQIEINREGLSTGLYFYQVTTAENFVANGKIIVE